MRWSSFLNGLLATLFILYCVEAGAFLVLVPWKATWVRFAGSLPWGGANGVLLHPLARGAVSGFGLVHLVWGIHDLEALLSSRRRRRTSTTTSDLGYP